ncbi:MAG: hypothetical protein ACYC2G_11040 [Gemmatimonadaceae bacterium]
MMQSTQLHQPRFALPPPAAMKMIDGNRHVGWVSGRLLGFRGFDSEEQAMHAAWVVYRTIARRVAWRDGRRPMPVDVEEVSLRRGPLADRIVAGRRPIATLIRPGSRSHDGPHGFGFELELPDSLDEQSIRAKADLAYRTLRRSGVAWALWSRRPRERATPGRDAVVAPPRTTTRTTIRTKAAVAGPREHPGRLEMASLAAVAAGLLGFVLLVAAVVIPRPLMAPLIAVGLVGVLGARLLSASRPGPRAPRIGVPRSSGIVTGSGQRSPWSPTCHGGRTGMGVRREDVRTRARDGRTARSATP